MSQDLCSYNTNVRTTRQAETVCHHAMENYKEDLHLVQELENKLGISQHWVSGDPEWENTKHLVTNRKYQRAVDHLEGLVAACIFELTKMSRAGTGL